MKKKKPIVPELLAPAQADKTYKVCALQTDHHDLKSWSITLDGENVSIYNQENGQESKQKIIIPHSKFKAMARWFNKKQITRKR